MASGVKIRKKKKSSAPRRGTRGLQAPSFEGWENLDGAKYSRLKSSVHDFYYMNFKYSDNVEHTFTWMKQNGHTKDDIASVRKAGKFQIVLGINCKLLLDGCPDYNEKEQEYWQSCPGTSGDIKPMTEWITKRIAELIETGSTMIEEKKEEEKKTKKGYVPTIQERLEEAAEEKIEDIETWIDEFIIDPQKNKLKDKNILQTLKRVGTNLGHVRFMRKWYTGPLEEYRELDTLPAPAKRDEMQKQLEEGYAHLNKAQRKDALTFYERMFQAFDIMLAENKHTRIVRKPKQKTAAEQTKKLKYKVYDSDFGITSKEPAEIIDSTLLVVFNCKTRKIGVYYPEPHATLKVKGTTIQFFDAERSVQKTIRKPQEVLSQWKKITKHKVPKQFEILKTTETKLNGRFNPETIILQVFK